MERESLKSGLPLFLRPIAEQAIHKIYKYSLNDIKKAVKFLSL